MQNGSVSRIYTHVIMPDINKLIGAAGRAIGPMPNFAYYEGAFSLEYFRTSRLRLICNELVC